MCGQKTGLFRGRNSPSTRTECPEILRGWPIAYVIFVRFLVSSISLSLSLASTHELVFSLFVRLPPDPSRLPLASYPSPRRTSAPIWGASGKHWPNFIRCGPELAYCLGEVSVVGVEQGSSWHPPFFLSHSTKNNSFLQSSIGFS